MLRGKIAPALRSSRPGPLAIQPMLSRGLAFNLGKLEGTLERIGAQLGGEDESTKAKTSNELEHTLRKLLGAQLDKHVSNPALDQHFQELFSGLDTIAPRPSLQPVTDNEVSAVLHARGIQRINLVLKPSRTGKEIVTLLRVLNGHSNLHQQLALRALLDPRLSVEEITQLLDMASHGKAMLKWTVSERLWFQLNAANLLWKHGRKRQAQALVQRQIRDVWLAAQPEQTCILPPHRMRTLIRAAFAAQGGLESRIAVRIAQLRDKPSIYIFWACALQSGRWDLVPLVLKDQRDPVFTALEAVTEAAQHTGLRPANIQSLKPLLELVPKAGTWPKQLRDDLKVAAQSLGGHQLAAYVSELLSPAIHDTRPGPRAPAAELLAEI